MTAPLAYPAITTSATGDWMHNRLTEARGVLERVAFNVSRILRL